MYEQITYDVNDPVAVITLNRPDKLNAWTGQMANEVRHAMGQAEADERVVGIILTGAGRAFCAGADMGRLRATADGEAQNGEQERSADVGDPSINPAYRMDYSYFASVRKPIIAAIHGPCAGMAVPIACFCDMRFASDKAVFITAFVRRGLIAEWGTSWMLPRLVGMANAMDMLLSSRKVGADEALRMGLVNRVVAEDQLLNEAQSYIEELAANCSPTSMAVMKRELYQHWQTDLGTAWNEAVGLMLQSFDAPDFKEGVHSFMEKRPPQFARIGDSSLSAARV